jgi:hypothetical protein
MNLILAIMKDNLCSTLALLLHYVDMNCTHRSQIVLPIRLPADLIVFARLYNKNLGVSTVGPQHMAHLHFAPSPGAGVL